MAVLSESPAGVDERWRDEFTAVAGAHRGVRVDGVVLDPAARRILGRSLATFQVGESGTGEHLFAAARAAGVDEAYLAALRAFVAEEQEHARLLALVLTDLGLPLRESHWTDRIFVVVRRIKSLRSEVLTLLVAELIALRYYSALRDGLADPQLADVCARIHADEERHVDFHAATLPAHLGRFPAVVRLLVRVLWNLLVTGASVVVALDHGRALGLAGVGRIAFVRDVARLRADLDRRLFAGLGHRPPGG